MRALRSNLCFATWKLYARTGSKRGWLGQALVLAAQAVPTPGLWLTRIRVIH